MSNTLPMCDKLLYTNLPEREEVNIYNGKITGVAGMARVARPPGEERAADVAAAQAPLARLLCTVLSGSKAQPSWSMESG